MKTGLLIAAMAIVLAGCGGDRGDIKIDGKSFGGSAKRERGDRAAFVATGGKASDSLEGARQAAVYEGIKYCLKYLGTSDIAWEQGPDVEDEDLVVDRDRVVFRGRCIEP